jgi:EAL domain-containing protein (putative c-di-GMP-specific phosphodiesterase class I)
LPEEFLALAEESGSVEQIDWQMFDKTCQQLRALVRGDQYVTFNLSPRHFRSTDLPRRFLALLASHDIAPQPGARGGDRGHAARKSRAGLRDDRRAARGRDPGGAGRLRHRLFVLSYLQPLPAARAEDRPLLHRQPAPGGTAASTAIVRAVLALARRWDWKWWPKASRRRSNAQCLLDLGCEYGQGFLFAAAQPAPQRAD